MGKILSMIIIILALYSCISTENVDLEDSVPTELSIDAIKVDDENENENEENSSLGEEFAFTEEKSNIFTTGDNLQIYQSIKGDTLMLIAFRLYGDYRKWKELYSLNKNILGDSYDLSHRPTLKYRKPPTRFLRPNGYPYLIKTGDSLSQISEKVYGDWRQWPVIRKNNPKQIRFADLIFAGFILYYPSFSNVTLN